MNSNQSHGYFPGASLLVASFLLAACEKTPAVAPGDPAPLDATAQAVAPAIISPDEAASLEGSPSYEVSIATARADQKHAKEKCAELPEAELAACEAAADAAYSSAQSDLENLRGNPE